MCAQTRELFAKGKRKQTQHNTRNHKQVRSSEDKAMNKLIAIQAHFPPEILSKSMKCS